MTSMCTNTSIFLYDLHTDSFKIQDRSSYRTSLESNLPWTLKISKFHFISFHICGPSSTFPSTKPLKNQRQDATGLPWSPRRWSWMTHCFWLLMPVLWHQARAKQAWSCQGFQSNETELLFFGMKDPPRIPMHRVGFILPKMSEISVGVCHFKEKTLHHGIGICQYCGQKLSQYP